MSIPGFDWYNANLMAASTIDLRQFLGREPERLSLAEREALSGKWIAMEMYTPQTLPLRRIEAIGDSVADCVRQLTERGLDARRFEFESLRWPYV